MCLVSSIDANVISEFKAVTKKSFLSFSIRKKKSYFCEKQKVVRNLFNLMNVIIIIIAIFFNQDLNLKKICFSRYHFVNESHR